MQAHYAMNAARQALCAPVGDREWSCACQIQSFGPAFEQGDIDYKDPLVRAPCTFATCIASFVRTPPSHPTVGHFTFKTARRVEYQHP